MMKTIGRMLVILVILLLFAACGTGSTTPQGVPDDEPTPEQLPADEIEIPGGITVEPERGPRGTTHTISINAPGAAGSEVTFEIIHDESGQQHLALTMRLDENGQAEVVIESEQDDAGVYNVFVSDSIGAIIAVGFFVVE